MITPLDDIGKHRRNVQTLPVIQHMPPDRPTISTVKKSSKLTQLLRTVFYRFVAQSPNKLVISYKDRLFINRHNWNRSTLTFQQMTTKVTNRHLKTELIPRK